MAYEPKLLTPFKETGLSQWYKPFLIGQQAFPDISDAYPWRGSVRKRDGFTVLAKLTAGPVMGLRTYEQANADNQLIAFNQTQAFLFNPGGPSFTNISNYQVGGPFTWTGGATDYFWSTNYDTMLWVTNTYNTNSDPIRFMHANNTWSNQTPILSSIGAITRTLTKAFIIIAHKGRLIALGTTETTTGIGTPQVFNNRARWSQLGSPFVPDITLNDVSPYTTDINAWNDVIGGRGGFVDADTNENIVSCGIIKDVLMVFFTNSTWRLRYTGNEANPFIWERINTQFGSESVMSTVPFDDYLYTFSRRGWIKSDTNAVERIDLQIPDISFTVEADASLIGLRRIHGVRDYYREIAYWTYPSLGFTQSNQIYLYNYRDTTWSKFQQRFNCFGQFRLVSDITWASLSGADDIWENWSSPNDTWIAHMNAGFPFIVAGDPTAGIAQVGSLAGNVYIVYNNFDADRQDYIDEVTPDTSFTTNFNFSITTKQLNPYLEEGTRCKLGYADLYCSTSPNAQITCQHYIDGQEIPILERVVQTAPTQKIPIIAMLGFAALTIVTTGTPHGLANGQYVFISGINGTIGEDINENSFKILVLSATSFTFAQNTAGKTYVSGGYAYVALPTNAPTRYVRIFLGAIGRLHQLVFTLNANQLDDSVAGKSVFEMQALVLWTTRGGRIKN